MEVLDSVESVDCLNNNKIINNQDINDSINAAGEIIYNYIDHDDDVNLDSSSKDCKFDLHLNSNHLKSIKMTNYNHDKDIIIKDVVIFNESEKRTFYDD